MSTFAIPQHPAVENYPDESAFETEIATARKFVDSELDSSEGWEEAGVRDGVTLWRKPDPNDAYAVPAVRGTCTIEDATTDQVMAVIQLPGMRKIWDPRFESGDMLKRFSRLKYQFVSVMKGLSWLIWPRDIVGAQRNFRSTKLNEEINCIQVSVADPEFPDQSGKVRAKVTGSGWRLRPSGKDVEVAYLVKISLEGSIPVAVMQQLAVEIPTCTGRVRDTFYEHGFPPFAVPAGDEEPATIFQTESFELQPSPTWECFFTAKSGAWGVVYDTTRMFAGGVSAYCDIDGVDIKDDGKGHLDIHISSSADGKVGKLVVTAK